MAHTSKTTTPHAGVIIWNYQDRINASGGKNVHKIQKIIISSSDLMSIATSKNKSTPAGSFEFHLAPTHNWVSRITPGSWCVLLMSQNKPVPQISDLDPGSADPELVKMLGRISEVRVAVQVDQDSGARKTVYVVTGQDWCSVFDTKLYIDAIARNNLLDAQSPMGSAGRLGFDNFYTEWGDKKHGGLPTSSQMLSIIIKIWGSPVSNIESSINSQLGAIAAAAGQPAPNLVLSSEAQFKLPAEVVKYMGLGDGGIGGAPSNFAALIKRRDGILKHYDVYGGDNEEAQGIPQPDSFYKVNTFWQMLVDNSNPVINELVTDIRWEGTQANLTLYKRVKPFINRKHFDGHDGGSNDGPNITKNISRFSDIRRCLIPLEDVVSINAGTNYRDKFNFIEMRPGQQTHKVGQTNLDTQVKVGSQSVDRPAYEREGFKPLIQTYYYMPVRSGAFQPLDALQWRFLLREWYFNTHLMLNGSATIIGQNQYIQVGDNIQIDANVFGDTSFNSLQASTSATVYFTAHVEAISHNFTIEPNGGARSFATTIQFVRGVMTDKDGKIFDANSSLIPGIPTINPASGAIDSPLDGALDRSADSMSTAQTKSNRVVTTTTSTNPDKSKVKGV